LLRAGSSGGLLFIDRNFNRGSIRLRTLRLCSGQTGQALRICADFVSVGLVFYPTSILNIIILSEALVLRVCAQLTNTPTKQKLP